MVKQGRLKQKKDTPQRARRLSRVLVLLLGGIIAGALFTVALAALFFVRARGIERTAPEITLESKNRVVADSGVEIPLTVRDDGAGLERVVVWVQQGNKVQEVFRRSLKQDQQISETIKIVPKDFGLGQGDVAVIIEAMDAAIWNNTDTRVLSLVVDHEPPRIDVLARSEAIGVGQLGIAAYRVTDTSLSSSGVSLKTGKDRDALYEFRGLPAKDIDAAMTTPGLFIAFFTSPDSCPVSAGVVAADEANNASRTPMHLECSSEHGMEEYRQPVTPREVLDKAEVLSSNGGAWGEALKEEINKIKVEGVKRDRVAATAVARFILTTARAADMEEVVRAARQSLGGGRWWRSGARVGVFSERSGYHNTTVLADEQGAIASFKSRSVELVPQQPGFSVVFSPYRGVVRLSRRLGVLGEVVVIDHGAGLSSVFYSLEGRYVETGGTVEEGQQIGRIGDSGFHFSKALRLYFLLDGVPIDPGALLDVQRFYQNVEVPLNGVRSKIGVGSPWSNRSGF